MRTFSGEDDLVSFLREHDLDKYGVSMAPKGRTLLDGWTQGPYHIEGYFYVKDTLKFPVGEKFRCRSGYSDPDDCWKSIRRVRERLKKP